jgi:hypothetical protein
MDLEYINERAKKFTLSIERDAFLEGVRLGIGTILANLKKEEQIA